MYPRNKIGVLLLVSGLLAFGYFQEFVKVNINYHLDLMGKIESYDLLSTEDRLAEGARLRKDVPYDYYHSHQRIDLLFSWTKAEVVLAKWSGAGLFVLIHFAFAWWIITLLYGRRSYQKWLVYLYGALSILVAASFLLATFSHLASMYQVSRKMLSFMQSVLPLMVIYPLVYLKRRIR